MPRKSKTSFADQAKKYINKASMREGDPISEKSLMANLSILRDKQEMVREKKGLIDDTTEEFAYGGMMNYNYGGMMYQNGGTIPTFSGAQVPNTGFFLPGFTPPTNNLNTIQPGPFPVFSGTGQGVNATGPTGNPLFRPTLENVPRSIPAPVDTTYPLDLQGNPLSNIANQPFGYNPFGPGLQDSTTVTPTTPQRTTTTNVDATPRTGTRGGAPSASRSRARGSGRTRPIESGLSLPTRTGDVFDEGTLQLPVDAGTTTPEGTTESRRRRGFFTPGERSGLRPSDYTQAGILAASTVGNLLLNQRPEEIDATEFYAPFLNQGPDLAVDEAPIRRTFAGARTGLGTGAGSSEELLAGQLALAAAEAEAIGNQATNVANTNLARRDAVDRTNVGIGASNAATRARVSELNEANIAAV